MRLPCESIVEHLEIDRNIQPGGGRICENSFV